MSDTFRTTPPPADKDDRTKRDVELRIYIRRVFWAAEAVLLVGSLAVTMWISRVEEWEPLLLVGLLLALTLTGQWFTFEVRGKRSPRRSSRWCWRCACWAPRRRSSSASARDPHFGLRGVCRLHCGSTTSHLRCLSLRRGPDGARRDRQRPRPATHGIDSRLHLRAGRVRASPSSRTRSTSCRSRSTLDVYGGPSLLRQVRELFVPMLPGQLAAGALAAVLAVAYTNLGMPALLGSVLVLVIFHYLMVALLRSEDRADQLEARSIHLASLQLGVLAHAGRGPGPARSHDQPPRSRGRPLRAQPCGRARRNPRKSRSSSTPPACCTTSASSRCPTASSKRTSSQTRTGR